MIRESVIAVLGAAVFAIGFVGFSSYPGGLDEDTALAAAALVISLGSHYLIRSFPVAGTLAGACSAVIFHKIGILAVSNYVGFNVWTLTIEGVIGFGFAFLVSIPFLLVRAGHVRKPPSGYCQKCGYNLTGNVSGVCPECGTKVESP
ncbi:MAG: hypothetical protein ACYTFA_15695 [Planctomycetota bacterium]|jgi:hypothetical protein